METMFESLKLGQEVLRLKKPPITKVQLVRYAGASGDFNPLHTDDEFAKTAGFDGVVAHGMLLMGFVAEAITSWIPKRYLKSIKVRFKGITKPGDQITITGNIIGKRVDGKKGIVDCSIEAADQNNEIKVAGSFVAILPIVK